MRSYKRLNDCIAVLGVTTILIKNEGSITEKKLRCHRRQFLIIIIIITIFIQGAHFTKSDIQ